MKEKMIRINSKGKIRVSQINPNNFFGVKDYKGFRDVLNWAVNKAKNEKDLFSKCSYLSNTLDLIYGTSFPSKMEFDKICSEVGITFEEFRQYMSKMDSNKNYSFFWKMLEDER